MSTGWKRTTCCPAAAFWALSSDKMEHGCCKTHSPRQNGSFNKKVVVENGCSGEGGLTLETTPGGRRTLLCGFNVMLIDSMFPPPLCLRHRSTMKDGIANNSTASISQARKAVEQLKMEACMDRIKVEHFYSTCVWEQIFTHVSVWPNCLTVYFTLKKKRQKKTGTKQNCWKLQLHSAISCNYKIWHTLREKEKHIFIISCNFAPLNEPHCLKWLPLNVITSATVDYFD